MESGGHEEDSWEGCRKEREGEVIKFYLNFFKKIKKDEKKVWGWGYRLAIEQHVYC